MFAYEKVKKYIKKYIKLPCQTNQHGSARNEKQHGECVGWEQIHFEPQTCILNSGCMFLSAYPSLNPSPPTRCNSVFTGNASPTSAFVYRANSPPPPLPPLLSSTSSLPPLSSSVEATASLVSHKSHLHVAPVSE